jgi:AcrR family transcriptional regulator
MSTTATTPPQRPLRRDAERNRHRVLGAALAVVSERGEDASMDDIAARAGVGVGTLYRRFPSKSDLIDALVDDLTIQLSDLARAAYAAAPATGLRDFLFAAGAVLAERRGCLPRLWNRSTVSPAMTTLRATLADLLAAAKAAHQVDAAVELGDLSVLLWALRGVIETTGDVAPDAWKRHLDIHLSGLRAPLRTANAALGTPATDRILLARR